MQTYSKAGVYSISGGVVLGNPRFLAAFAGNGGTFGSAPNLYGTANFADPSLQNTIKLALPAAEDVTKVSLTLFNGQAFQENYEIDVTVGGVPISTPVTLGPGSDANASASNFSVTSFTGPITEVDVFTPNATTNGWDFFVDDIKLHGNATPAVAPEPSSIVLLTVMGGLVALSYARRRRKDGLPEAGAAS